jgi:Flp pilus assembly pilin Flp
MVEVITAAVVRVQNAYFAARNNEEGQTLVEYALIIAVVSLGALVALGFLSGRIQDLFSRAGNSLNEVPVQTGTTP